MFSSQEVAYLRSQPLLRLATVAPDGQPTVDAVAYSFDGHYFSISGYTLEQTRKYKNVAAGHQQVALIIDDLASTTPWTPRGIKVHGTARIATQAGQNEPRVVLRVAPSVTWSWGIDGPSFQNNKFVPTKRVWQPS